MARPTTYSAETLLQAEAYLSDFADDGQVIPSVAGLAVRLNVSRSTIYEWRDTSGREEFSDTLERLLATQEVLLVNRGLSGDFNSNICKLALGNHGYSERKDITNAYADYAPKSLSDFYADQEVA